jgi:hypothetical protein
MIRLSPTTSKSRLPTLLVASLLLLAGCGTNTTANATPAATQTPYVIVRVVTATPPPATATAVAVASPATTSAEATASSDTTATLVQPSATASPPTATQQPADAATPTTTFRVCANTGTQTEQAIAQFIAGRSFSSRLVGRQDGCADLTITVPPGAQVTSGRQSSSVSVSNVMVQIVSSGGTTQVHIGPRGG